MEALFIGGALFLVLSAVISVFVFLMKTVPFLAISILVISIFAFFVLINRIAKSYISKNNYRKDFNNSNLMYFIVNLTALLSMFIIIGFIGSFLSPDINEVSFRDGVFYLLEEISKKIDR